MTNYLIALIVALLLVIAVMFGMIRIQSGKIEKLSKDLGTSETNYNNCVDINKENLKTYNTIIAANKAAQVIADQEKNRAIADAKKARQRIREILNAKDNGPIPGVVQRTLDGLRERADSYQDRESSAANTRGTTVMHVPS